MTPLHGLDDVSARPLIIGGMHRSGTSLTASIFASAGLDLGPALLGACESNPLGHYEDLGFLDFHCRALVAQGLGSEGFTTGAHGSVPPALQPEAHALVAARMRPGIAWGWKEPRTVLFLDFWQQHLPDPRYVFVYRRPWEVADSLFRRGDATFFHNPAFAFEVWTHYNRLIIDFVRRHPSRCVVFEITQVIGDAGGTLATVQSRLGIPLGPPADRYRDALLTLDNGGTRPSLVRAIAPEAWATYLALCEFAGVAPESEAATPLRVSVGDCAVMEWARASRAEAQAKKATEGGDRGVADCEAPVRAAGGTRLQAWLAFLHRFGRRLVEGGAAVWRRLVGRPLTDAPHPESTLLPFPGRSDGRVA